MDFLRSCYSSTWLFPEKPGPCPGYFYFCDPGTPHYPNLHYFGSRNWHENDGTPDPTYGEQPGPQTWRNGSFPIRKPDPIVIGTQDCIENGNNAGDSPAITLLFGVDARCWRAPPMGGGLLLGSAGRSQTTRGGIRLGGPGNATNPPIFSGGIKFGGQARGQVVRAGLAIGGKIIPLRGGLKIGGTRPFTTTGGLLLGGQGKSALRSGGLKFGGSGTGRPFKPSLRQQGGGGVGNGTGTVTIVPTWGTQILAGNGLVAVVAVNNSSGAPSITPPSGWSLAINNISGTHGVAIYVCPQATVAQSTATWSFTASAGTSHVALNIDEFNIAGLLIVDKTATASGSGTALSTGTTAATSTAVEVCVAGWSLDVNGSVTGASGGFGLPTFTATTSCTSCSAQKITTTAGTQACATTGSPTSNWAGAVACMQG